MMLTDLQGQIERITYTNDETGYTIAKIKLIFDSCKPQRGFLIV